MESVLTTLIKQLESEKANLLRLIDEAVKEREFMHAHFHSEALSLLEDQIGKLKGLDDTHYYEKEALIELIERMNGMLDDSVGDVRRRFTEQIIAEAQAKLAALVQQGNVPADNKHATQVNRLVIELVNKKLKRFRIVLMKEPQLIVELKRSRHDITVSIGNINTLRREELLDDDNVVILTAIGFKLNSTGRKFILVLGDVVPESADKLMTVLSRVFFDVFNLSEAVKNAFIEL